MVTPQHKYTPRVNIEHEVELVTSGTLGKNVPVPNRVTTLSNLIIRLKRYKHAIRWKDNFLRNTIVDNKTGIKEITEKGPNSAISPKCHNAKTKPLNNSDNAPVGSLVLDSFSKELEETLFKKVYKYHDKN